MNDIVAKIILNEPVAQNFFRMRFGVNWKKFEPGQFVMVGVDDGSFFLRRPFGIVEVRDNAAEICFKIVGRGTTFLSKLPIGSEINVLGPCGNGFDTGDGFKTAVLVAGGYGIAPLFGLAAKLALSRKKTVLYYGAKDRAHLLYLNELEKMNIDLRLATEDGSEGIKGIVTDMLCEIKTAEAPKIFACGPNALLKSIKNISRDCSIPAAVAVEKNMACGIGVCLGCACKNRQGDYVRVCKEGPVFDIEELSDDM